MVLFPQTFSEVLGIETQNKNSTFNVIPPSDEEDIQINTHLPKSLIINKYASKDYGFTEYKAFKLCLEVTEASQTRGPLKDESLMSHA